MIDSINANINTAQCMVDKTHLGYDDFINVCTGAHQDVYWTIVDWSALVGMALLIAIIFGLCAIFICTVLSAGR